MRCHRSILLATAFSVAAVASAAAQTDAEKKAVLAPIDQMFNGMKTRDTLMIRNAFVSDGRLIDIRNRAGQPTVVRGLPAADFARSFAGGPAGQELVERYWDEKILIEDNVASVWVTYDFHVGTRFTHCGIDAFQLARTSDGWKIVQVMDTRRTTNCPTPPKL